MYVVALVCVDHAYIHAYSLIHLCFGVIISLCMSWSRNLKLQLQEFTVLYCPHTYTCTLTLQYKLWSSQHTICMFWCLCLVYVIHCFSTLSFQGNECWPRADVKHSYFWNSSSYLISVCSCVSVSPAQHWPWVCKYHPQLIQPSSLITRVHVGSLYYSPPCTGLWCCRSWRYGVLFYPHQNSIPYSLYKSGWIAAEVFSLKH